jgi:ABC-2 type transport system permease protein
VFPELLLFEVRNRLWRLSSLVYALVFFGLGFVLALWVAGVLPGGPLSIGASGKVYVNSPYAIFILVSMAGYFGLLIVAPIFGQSINKDFEGRFGQVLFATPLKKSTYFIVRYLGSAISCVTILSSTALGIFLATVMPFVDPSVLGKNHIWYYLAPYVTIILPNTLTFGAIFTAVAAIARRMAPVYVASILVFTFWMVSKVFTHSLSDPTLSALLDPLGVEAAATVMRYWSFAEQTTRTLPVTGVFLQNRLLWGSVGIAIVCSAYALFNPFKQPAEKPAQKFGNGVQQTLNEIQLPRPVVAPHSVAVLRDLVATELKLVSSNIHIRLILLCAIAFVFSTAQHIGEIYGTKTFPVTYNVLETVNGYFSLFMAIITSFYAGELIWKERDAHFAELVDSKPVSNVHLYVSKLLALCSVTFTVLCLALICCVIIQTAMGYYNYEFGLYFLHLFVFCLVPWVLVNVIALLVHTLSKQKYIGHSIVIFYFALIPTIKELGFDHHLYLIGYIPLADYSDMNGYGASVYPFVVYSIYWGLFALICIILNLLCWPRGAEQAYRSRLKDFRRSLTPAYRAALAVSACAFVAVGGFVFYNTNILNSYTSKGDGEREQADYESQFKVFERMPQPELIAAKLEVDIFPEKQGLRTRGQLTFKNKTNVLINKLMLDMDADLTAKKLAWSVPSKLTLENERLGVKVYEFERPLAPGNTVLLDFDLCREPQGFANEEFSKDIVQNGSFIHNGAFVPSVGYSGRAEIADVKTRRKYGLAEKQRMPKVTDKVALEKTYISNEGSWIDFEATVSTSSDQIALAPGSLIKEWKANGRNYFHYRMDRPMLDYYAILSGRYQVARDKWNDVDIEVYYHPSHTYNIARMIKAAKQSLDYCSKNFSPYQFKQLRIAEFPRYQKCAQSFATLIPFSESAGFIANVNAGGSKSIDYPSFVTMHEVSHQWWAHQVIGGNVQGATMLSESLAEYCALVMQEKVAEPKLMKSLRGFELDQYLSGRRTELEKELPLALNEKQEYIHYGKGGLAFFALKDNLGEETVNKVLRDYLRAVRFQQAPFTRAADLVQRLRDAAPPDKKYLIEDLFDTITFYVIDTDFLRSKRVGNQFNVTLRGIAHKFRVDGDGNGTEIPMNDLVDVVLYDDQGKIIYLKKHRLRTGITDVHVKVKVDPDRGGFDLLKKLIQVDSKASFVSLKDQK